MPEGKLEFPRVPYQRAKTYERVLLTVRTHLLSDQLTPEEFKVLETTLENLFNI